MKKDFIDILPNYISNVTIKNLAVKSIGLCQALCIKDCSCSMFRFESNICKTLSYKANDFLTENSNSSNILFIKKEYDILIFNLFS